MSPKKFKSLSPSARLCVIKGEEAYARKADLKRRMTPAEIHFLGILNTLRIPCSKQKVVFCEYRYFIMDFVLPGMAKQPKTIVELDGGCHIGREQYDNNRTALILKSKTYRNSEVLRFTNEQVFNGAATLALAARYPRAWRRYGHLLSKVS